AGIGGAVAATAGFVTPSLIIMIALAKLLAKYGDMGAIRGVLNGLRPAVVALIASAGVMFLTLSLWNEEKLPAVWSDPDLVSTIVLLVSLVLIKKKICGVIQTLVGSGLLSLALHFFIK
ncbi:chromate transporter, partial [Phascolarctobacterium faecium]